MELDLQRYDTYLFDLDDTLIDESKYLRAAYGVISRYMASKYGKNQHEMYSFLLKNGRKKLFNRFLDEFSLPVTEMGELLEILRTVEVELHVFPEMMMKLRELVRNNKKIIIVTNGNHKQQANKLRCTDFAGLMYHIDVIFTNKPNTSGLSFNNAVMIGDSTIDKEFADNLGIPFIKK